MTPSFKYSEHCTGRLRHPPVKSLFHSSLVPINQHNSIHTPMKQEPGVTGSLSPEERTISPWVISLHYINESKGSIWGNSENALNRAVRHKQFRNRIVLMGLKGPITDISGIFHQHFQVTFSQCDTAFMLTCLWLILSASIYFVYRFNIWHYSSKELTISLCLLFPLLLQSKTDGKLNKQWQT